MPVPITAPSMRLEGGLQAESDRTAAGWADGRAERARLAMQRWFPYYVVLPDGTNVVCIEFPIYREKDPPPENAWSADTWKSAAEVTDSIGLTVIGWPDGNGPICCRFKVAVEIDRDATTVASLLATTSPLEQYNDYVFLDLAVQLRIADRHYTALDGSNDTGGVYMRDPARGAAGYGDRSLTSFGQSIRHAYRRWLSDRGVPADDVCERWLGYAAECEFLMQLARRMLGPVRSLMTSPWAPLSSSQWLALNRKDGSGSNLLGLSLMHRLMGGFFILEGTLLPGHGLDPALPPEENFLRGARNVALYKHQAAPGNPAGEMAAIRSLLRAERIAQYAAPSVVATRVHDSMSRS